MSITKISSFAITAIAAIVLTAGAASAKSYDTHHRTMVSSSVPDNNTPIGSLPAKQFFERLQEYGG